jgi:hypothetical protein
MGVPANGNLHIGATLTFLTAELHRRRRSRLTGKVRRLDKESFASKWTRASAITRNTSMLVLRVHFALLKGSCGFGEEHKCPSGIILFFGIAFAA